MKKLLLLGVIAAIGYVVYRQRMASRAEDDLWSEATAAPDLTAAYQPAPTAAEFADSVDFEPEEEQPEGQPEQP